MQFCTECNNLLHPKEDKLNRKLKYACRHCDFQMDAPSQIIYDNKIKKDTAMRLDLVDSDFAMDPTLPRTFETECPSCSNNEAVFFMSRSGGRDSDMALVFLCVSCHHKWIN